MVPYDYHTRLDADEAIRYAQQILSWVDGVWRQLKRE